MRQAEDGVSTIHSKESEFFILLVITTLIHSNNETISIIAYDFDECEVFLMIDDGCVVVRKNRRAEEMVATHGKKTHQFLALLVTIKLICIISIVLSVDTSCSDESEVLLMMDDGCILGKGKEGWRWATAKSLYNLATTPLSTSLRLFSGDPDDHKHFKESDPP
jgi:hypothetical protein